MKSKNNSQDTKLTLLCSHKKIVFKQMSTEPLNMLHVLLLCLRKNENVINIDKQELIQHEHIIGALVSLNGITWSSK